MRRNEICLITLLVVALTLPFLDKPFHIDDTFVLHVTGNILNSFWDPFAGQIDWFGYEQEVWKATTNPPFLSYYLSPFALLSDYSEIVLHLAMLVFFLLLAFSMQSLAKRFVSSGYWPLLFLMTSVAVVVSGNVMRDIPGTALGVAGVACFILGSDRNRKRLLFLGAFLAGLAVFTKYSAAVVLPVMALYALLRGRPRHVIWLAVSLAFPAFWCLHNWVVYGQVHMLYLLLERRSSAYFLWQHKLFGALTVLGSSCMLFPIFLAESIRRRQWFVLSVGLSFVLITFWGYFALYEAELDVEYLFWAGAGVGMFTLPILGSLCSKVRNRDSLFLAVWCGGVVWFSVFMVPFQAVRHLLPALTPLVLLGFRYLRVSESLCFRKKRNILGLLLVIQVGIAGIVHLADYEYAACYRKFSKNVGERDDPIWYVGHWGWKFYADRTGFRPLHRGGPYPSQGDLLLWPEKVNIGRVFQNERGLRDRLELVSREVCEGVIPVRTMDRESRAGFYSVGHRRLPYRLFPEGPVEVLRIYRVREDWQPSP